ncbi:MAG: acyl-[acyl-carrier-protein] thioesterase [Bacillota bacterium]
MQAEQEFFIGMQDVGINNEMTNKAFLEALTNVTNVHGSLVGQGINDLGKRHISWVVLNWKLEVYQRPKICETILVKTWGQEYSRARAYRDYDVFNQKGEIIAKATSTWLAVNTETGKPIRLTDDIVGVYGCEPQHKNFPDFRFTESVDTDLQIVSETRFKINKSMIDCNNHVHNPSYMDLVNEVLPEGTDNIFYNNIEVSYKKEIKLHEEVLLEYAADGVKNYVFMWDESKRILHATVIMY